LFHSKKVINSNVLLYYIIIYYSNYGLLTLHCNLFTKNFFVLVYIKNIKSKRIVGKAELVLKICYINYINKLFKIN